MPQRLLTDALRSDWRITGLTGVGGWALPCEGRGVQLYQQEGTCSVWPCGHLPAELLGGDLGSVRRGSVSPTPTVLAAEIREPPHVS